MRDRVTVVGWLVAALAHLGPQRDQGLAAARAANRELMARLNTRS